MAEKELTRAQTIRLTTQKMIGLIHDFNQAQKGIQRLATLVGKDAVFEGTLQVPQFVGDTDQVVPVAVQKKYQLRGILDTLHSMEKTVYSSAKQQIIDSTKSKRQGGTIGYVLVSQQVLDQIFALLRGTALTAAQQAVLPLEGGNSMTTRGAFQAMLWLLYHTSPGVKGSAQKVVGGTNGAVFNLAPIRGLYELARQNAAASPGNPKAQKAWAGIQPEAGADGQEVLRVQQIANFVNLLTTSQPSADLDEGTKNAIKAQAAVAKQAYDAVAQPYRDAAKAASTAARKTSPKKRGLSATKASTKAFMHANLI